VPDDGRIRSCTNPYILYGGSDRFTSRNHLNHRHCIEPETERGSLNMNEGFVTIYIFLGILLRFAVPLAITFLLARLLRKLDRKWREEAKLEKEQSRLVFINLFQQQPCWDYNHCSSAQRATCPVYNQKQLPCWEIQRSNGSLKAACQTCEYRQHVMVPAGD
jgi:hypothetical protein